jgi:hypothetical protein
MASIGAFISVLGPLDPSQGVVLFRVDDCSVYPVRGATVTSTPAAGKTFYINGALPDTDPSATTFDNGAGGLVNVPAGMASLGVTVAAQNVTYPAYQVVVRAGVATVVPLHP